MTTRVGRHPDADIPLLDRGSFGRTIRPFGLCLVCAVWRPRRAWPPTPEVSGASHCHGRVGNAPTIRKAHVENEDS